MLSPKDFEQIKSLNISDATIERQLQYFRTGFPFIQLDRPATTGDGIIRFGEESKNHYVGFFEQHAQNLRILKFVPASGAASRMFKALHEFSEKYAGKKVDPDTDLTGKENESLHSFFKNLHSFAFYEDLDQAAASSGTTIMELLRQKELSRIVDLLLDDRGLAYSSMPKALLKFHRYPQGSRVAFEEHLVEAALYANNGKGSAPIHFTLSPEHIGKFHKKLAEVLPGYEDHFGLRFEISHSIQEKSTDTIAVDIENNPVRNSAGELLFRPGGHGALLTNLNSMDADLIFVKNIDNIVPDRLKDPTVEYKKLIGGYLLYLRQYIFRFLEKADQKILTESDLQEMKEFLDEKLFIKIPSEVETSGFDNRVKYICEILNRPIRVCGMVKNEGEPGGGPFWVTGPDGGKSLQIVESSQVDPKSDQQRSIMHNATHFNPVDLVCSIRNYKGETFDLREFVDPDTGFIAEKSAGGRVLKAQELPGLWNGAMAKWITVFAEIPIITFNPVKTVNDLLRKEHQP